uniref:Pyruvate dehydrogenase E1 component subunit beta n=1 Tax=Panagrolaimus sp. PS1159 TaxID=55785 RepID=A0AC35GF27_9BILA
MLGVNWNRVPIVLIAPSIGVHETRDFSKWYNHYPNLKVLAPYDSEDHKSLLKAAINDENPVIFLENQRLYDSSFCTTKKYFEADIISPLEIYDAKIAKEGSDVTIVAYSCT